MEFLSMHQEDRFNIIIDTSEYDFDFTKVKILNNIHKNLIFQIPPNPEIYKKLQEYKAKYYFDINYAAINFRSLEQLVRMGVSAIYIADDLCYNLKRVRQACDHFNIELR
jgi:hypothetical protein